MVLDLLRLEKSAPLAPMAGPDRAAALEKVNRFAPKPVQEDQIDLWTAVMANDQIDRTAEQFPLSYLERFAATLPGAPVLLEHDKRRVPVGRFYDARVEKDPTGGWQTVADFYVAAGSEASRLLSLGIAKEMSLGLMSAGRTCDIDGKKIDKSGRCEGGHQVGSTYDGRWASATHAGDTRHVTAFEGSLVGVGAQYGAGVIAAKTSEETMADQELEERVKALAAENERLKSELTVFHSQPAPSPDPLVEVGKVAIADSKAEIGRKLIVLEEDPAPTLALLDHADFATIKAWDAQLGKRIDAKFPPTPQSRPLDAGAVPAPDPRSTVPAVVPDNPYFARRS